MMDEARGKSDCALEPDKSRHQAYVEGLMDGKTKKRSALDAGFPLSRARNPKRRIEGPITQELMQKAMAKAGVTLALLAQKTREGLDAKRVQLLSGGTGKAATFEMVDDFDTRLKYIQHAHKMLGILELEEREPPSVQVNIVAVGGK